MAVVTIHSEFRAQEEDICHCFHHYPSVCHEVMGPVAMAGFFTLLLHHHQDVLEFLFAFCHYSAIIHICEVVDISPGSLDSSL